MSVWNNRRGKAAQFSGKMNWYLLCLVMRIATIALGFLCLIWVTGTKVFPLFNCCGFRKTEAICLFKTVWVFPGTLLKSCYFSSSDKHITWFSQRVLVVPHWINAQIWHLHVPMYCRVTCSSINFISTLIEFTISTAAESRSYVILSNAWQEKKGSIWRSFFCKEGDFDNCGIFCKEADFDNCDMN